MVNVARTVMFSIGCIQAQRCHTGRCLSGVATQSPRLEHGLDPDLKSVRYANYLVTLRFELVMAVDPRPVRLAFAHHDHRHAGRLDHRSGDRTDQHAGETAATVAAHHDQLGGF